MSSQVKVEQIDNVRFRIPKVGKMRVDGLVFANENMMADIRKDGSLTQVANVAHLPGIVGRSLGMSDIHSGYGFPIGGVAAFDENEGVLSPGGVGYDINCGVRLLRTNLVRKEIEKHLPALAEELFKAIPSGVGSKSHRPLTDKELDSVLFEGAFWAVKEGYGFPSDLEMTEESGVMKGAEPSAVSQRARERGLPQLGSLGSGNHFCEVGWVSEVYHHEAARAFGLTQGSVTIMIHSGSRGFGHQVCDDHLRTIWKASQEHGIELPDRQLCAAPLKSKEAQNYFRAMACAVNFAFANRQMLTHFVRQSFKKVFGQQAESLSLVYDVCHNIAKWEEHEVDGKKRRICVHRKGATRAFPKGHPDVPLRYRSIGQPVLVPGDMGRYSFVVVGTERAMAETWGSSCHGAGRRLSRKSALTQAKKRNIIKELYQDGVSVRAVSKQTLAEEMPDAYKDAADVVHVMEQAGLVSKVVRLEPLVVVKG